MSIRLPKNAIEYDYEDQVCALLHAHGYYLETRLILKKGSEEVLEFDAIATPTNDYKNRKVVEVKVENGVFQMSLNFMVRFCIHLKITHGLYIKTTTETKERPYKKCVAVFLLLQ